MKRRRPTLARAEEIAAAKLAQQQVRQRSAELLPASNRMTNPTDLAIRALNEFIDSWVAPAAKAHLGEHEDLAGVYAAIRAIAPAEQTIGLGYAVFGLKPETRERKRESGFETVVFSAVFDTPPTSVLESSIAGEPWTHGVREGLRFFGICQLQQIRT